MCMVCGVENACGLHARFLELDSGELMGVFDPREEHQGYPGRMHGGILTAIVDEAIGRAIAVGDPGAWGVTVELSMRFRRPVPLDRPIRVLARITEDNGRIFQGVGEIVLDDGTVAVTGWGKYMRLPIEKISVGDLSAEMRVDDRPAPEYIEIARP